MYRQLRSGRRVLTPVGAMVYSAAAVVIGFVLVVVFMLTIFRVGLDRLGDRECATASPAYAVELGCR